MKTEPRSGDIRATPYSDYEPGASGFVIEQFAHWNGGEGWAIPAWDEAGSGGLGGVFATLKAAKAAMSEAA